MFGRGGSRKTEGLEKENTGKLWKKKQTNKQKPSVRSWRECWSAQVPVAARAWRDPAALFFWEGLPGMLEFCRAALTEALLVNTRTNICAA